MNLLMVGNAKDRKIKHIEKLSNFELLEYLSLAVRLEANPKYIDMIKEEIFSRMEGGEA